MMHLATMTGGSMSQNMGKSQCLFSSWNLFCLQKL